MQVVRFYFVGSGSDVADQCCALPHPLPHPSAVELGSAPEPTEDPAELCFGRAAGGRLLAPHSSRAGLVHGGGQMLMGNKNQIKSADYSSSCRIRFLYCVSVVILFDSQGISNHCINHIKVHLTLIQTNCLVLHYKCLL